MIKPVRKLLTPILALAIAMSCFVFPAEAKRKRASHHAAPAVEQPENAKTTISQQTGTASWYGGSFIGRGTASGERYRAGDRTAAHRKLPFGTYVRVTNLTNNR